MIKKGDLLNQLAIISDLIENVNCEFLDRTIIFTLDENEYEKTYEYIIKKSEIPGLNDQNTFNLKIGLVEIIFNKNSV